MVKLRVAGGGLEVGRVALELIDGDSTVLLDCGVNFNEQDLPQFPLHIKPSNVKAIVLSHAHLDHVGAAPSLFVSTSIPVLTTKPTVEIAKLLILDFIKLSSYYIDYDVIELEAMVSNTIAVNYGEEVEKNGFIFTFTNANHILGSSLTYIETPSGYRILYTGDVNLTETRTLPPIELLGGGIDVLIIESTYGSRNHPSRSLIEKEFVKDVEEVVENGGTVLIPAFSVGRTQEVLAILQMEAPHIDVYLDGMGKDMTLIYLKYRGMLRDGNLFEKIVENTRFVKGWDERRKVWRRNCVIIASAGMLKGGPSLYYLKKIYDNPKNAVFMVSYQSPSSYGHMLLENGAIEEIGLDKLKAMLKWYDLSSHAGRDQLVKIVEKYRGSLKHVVIIHGEPDSISTLSKRIEEEIGGDVKIHTPSNGDVIDLT